MKQPLSAHTARGVIGSLTVWSLLCWANTALACRRNPAGLMHTPFQRDLVRFTSECLSALFYGVAQFALFGLFFLSQILIIWSALRLVGLRKTLGAPRSLFNAYYSLLLLSCGCTLFANVAGHVFESLAAIPLSQTHLFWKSLPMLAALLAVAFLFQRQLCGWMRVVVDLVLGVTKDAGIRHQPALHVESDAGQNAGRRKALLTSPARGHRISTSSTGSVPCNT